LAKAKFDASLEYVTNTKNAVKETSAKLKVAAHEKMLQQLAANARAEDDGSWAKESKTAHMVHLDGRVE
jgi:hypothetical protein